MVGNTEVTPDIAYRFARGEAVTVFGRKLQRPWPLDFLTVTDHTENLGLAYSLKDPKSRFGQTLLGRQLRGARDGFFATIEAYSRELDRGAFARTWAKEIGRLTVTTSPASLRPS
jgi:hypothetical protein